MNKIVISLLYFFVFPINLNGQSKALNEHEFTELFRKTNNLNLHIYSLSTKKEGNKFQGQEIPKKFYKYFPSNISLKGSQNSKIFACYKFDLDKNHLGLIVRKPSQYDNTLIELLAWNKLTQKIDYSYELADSFGDGDWYFSKDAWIVDFQNDKNFDIVIRRKDWSEDDNGKEHLKDSIFVVLNNGLKLKKCNRCKVDKDKYAIFDF